MKTGVPEFYILSLDFPLFDSDSDSPSEIIEEFRRNRRGSPPPIYTEAVLNS